MPGGVVSQGANGPGRGGVVSQGANGPGRGGVVSKGANGPGRGGPVRSIRERTGGPGQSSESRRRTVRGRIVRDDSLGSDGLDSVSLTEMVDWKWLTEQRSREGG